MDRFYIILFIVFGGINGLGIAYSHVLEVWGIENIAGMLGNILLAGVTGLSYYFSTKGIKGESNHAFVRMVYVSTFVKLMICAIAVLVYAYFFRENLTLGTLIFFFLLYILYTVIETLSLMKVAKSDSQ
jgi:hypothetical protein